MSLRSTSRWNGRRLVGFVACLALLGLALPQSGCGCDDKPGTGGTIDQPPPPPGPRIVRFLSDKKPRPKLWVRNKVDDKWTPVPYVYQDDWMAKYEFDPMATDIQVTMDSNGNGSEDSSDDVTEHPVEMTFVLDQHTATWDEDNAVWSVQEVLAQREDAGDPWNVAEFTWP